MEPSLEALQTWTPGAIKQYLFGIAFLLLTTEWSAADTEIGHRKGMSGRDLTIDLMIRQSAAGCRQNVPAGTWEQSPVLRGLGNVMSSLSGHDPREECNAS
jgi:hypothetical protein